MADHIRRIDYFYTTVGEELGVACTALRQLADLGVDLLAFTAVPMGPMRTQLTLFPADRPRLESAARSAGIRLDGPHPALLVQGDDELGALGRVHTALADASVQVYASSGVADGTGRFGYVLYVRPQDIGRAEAALKT